jgi:hypothetical protein
MADYSRDVRQELSKAGCHFLRQGKGDHEIWYCPALKRKITVDSKIKSRHTANAIMKAAGLKKPF